MDVRRGSVIERKRMSRLQQSVLLCGRVSDCNDCSKVTGLISGRSAQSGTITVKILWIKSARLRGSLHLTLTALESVFHYVSLFYSIFGFDCMYKVKQQYRFTLVTVLLPLRCSN